MLRIIIINKEKEKSISVIRKFNNMKNNAEEIYEATPWVWIRLRRWSTFKMHKTCDWLWLTIPRLLLDMTYSWANQKACAFQKGAVAEILAHTILFNELQKTRRPIYDGQNKIIAIKNIFPTFEISLGHPRRFWMKMTGKRSKH